MGGQIDGFIATTGTGGHVAGISKKLHEKSESKVKCFVVDPLSSGIFDYMRTSESKPQEIHGFSTRMVPRSEGTSSIEASE